MALITTGTATPSRIKAGDTVRWDITLPEFGASTHGLEYYLTSRKSEESLKWTATASGEIHQLRLTSADTTAIDPAAWAFSLVVTETSSGDRRQISDGIIIVDPPPGHRAEKSFAEEMVTGLRGYIKRRISDEKNEGEVKSP